jgi:hypothetical protein
VPHFLFTFVPKRSSPTLWEIPPETPEELEVWAYEEENRVLKNLVITLSEFILRDATCKK